MKTDASALVPLTVKAARKVARAVRWGAIPLGRIVATSVPGVALATGGPAPDASGSFVVDVYGGDRGGADAQRVALAVGRCALELGFARAEVRLPADAAGAILKRAGWRLLGTAGGEARWGVEGTPQRGDLRVVPLGQAEGNAAVEALHSHHGASRGSLFSVGVAGADGVVHCVAQAGVPRARMLMKPGVAEIVRVASDRTRNAASMAKGAAVRALLALGYTRVVSYTILGESGHSYRVAGWVPTAVSAGGEWSRPSRGRSKAQQALPKVRWEIGPAAARLPPAAEADLLARVAAATDPSSIPTRATAAVA